MITKSKTKIIATIGPASWDNEILSQMINNGMRIARINASFADPEELTRVATQIRTISPRISLMIDTQGGKIRVINIHNDIEVKNSAKLSSNEYPGVIQISYKTLAEDIKIGDKILIDDGNIELVTESINNDIVECKVIQEGILKSNKTVAIPSLNLHLPVLTERDKIGIRSAIENKYDFISLSFVKNKEDIKEVRNIIGNSNIKIISKIENKEGVDNFDEILSETDGIMIARGDLAVETPYEKVPILQKQFIYKCRAVGKPVIVATQMLESMRENIKPTRAEISDVSNAVMDGTDAIMLSAETSTGKHPVESVITMNTIASETEKYMQTTKIYGHTDASDEVDEICRNTCDISESISLKGIVVISKTGRTVASISRHRPNIPIWSISNSIERIRQDNIFFGVNTYFMREFPQDRDLLIDAVVDTVYSHGDLDLSDKIAIISGSSIRHNSTDATLEIVNVKDVLSR
ncbi:MAG: pyruvate kinase [Candidatus Dojkabacteria bacterium]|nr:pyruvate kinase [Candidatus Dojkabacteria bacterium]